MSAVLDYFREKEPKFKDVGDDELTQYIGSEHPEFLKDEEFKAQYEGKPKGPPSTADLAAGIRLSPYQQADLQSMREGRGKAPTGMEPGTELTTKIGADVMAGMEKLKTAIPKVSPEQVAAGLINLGRMDTGEPPIASDDPLAKQVAEEQPAVHGVAEAINQAPAAIPRAGKVLLAGAADITGGEGNLEAYMKDPVAPLPWEEALEEMPVGVRMPALAAAGILRMAPALAVGAGVAGATGSAAIGAGAPFLVNEAGELDPVGVAIASFLPGVVAGGEKAVAGLLAKMPVDRVMIENLGRGLRGKVVQKLGGVEISNDAFRSFLEKGGGALAANAYLLAAQTPEILALPPEQQQEAILDAVAGNIGVSLMGFMGRYGASRTLEQLFPTLKAEWARANMQGKPGVQPREPIEEGAPVPPPDAIRPTLLPAEPAAAEPPKPPAGPVPTPPLQPAPGTQAGGPPSPPPPAPAPPPVEPAPAPPTPGPPGGTSAAPPVAPSPAEPPPTPPAPAAPVPEGVEAYDTPEGPVMLGREVKVKGTGNQLARARYAWMPFKLIHASHAGELFGVNPAYAPLINTRDYERDKAEQEKVVAGAQNFDPADYVIHTQSAVMGPLMVAADRAGTVRVLGGNGRKQMLDRITPEKWNELGAIQDSEAAVFGLPPRPAPGHVLVRLFPVLDLEKPEGVLAARRLVDALNPSPGLVESTQKLAENDALNVPVEALLKVRPTSSTGLMREWMGRLLGDGIVDRNTRSRLLKSEEELRDYVRRLLIHAAFRDNVVSGIHANPYAPATIRNFIDVSTPAMLELRQAGPEGQTVANAWTEMFRRVAEMQVQYPDRKINRVLQDIADQVEMGEAPEVTLGRRLAMLLAGRVEMLPPNKRGDIKVDEKETTREWEEILQRFQRSVRLWQVENAQGGDIFGESRGLLQMVTEWLRANGGDAIVAGLPDLAQDVALYERPPVNLDIDLDGMPTGKVPPLPQSPEVVRQRSWRYRQIKRLKAGDLVSVNANTLRVVSVTPEKEFVRGRLVLHVEQPDNPAKWARFYLDENEDLYSLSQHEDQAQYASGPDPRVRRYKAIMRLREKLGGTLPQEVENELRGLEEALGQSFLAFFAQQSAKPEPPAETKAELEKRARRRLQAGPLAIQGSLLPEPGQLSLLEPQAPYELDLASQLQLLDPGWLPGLYVKPNYITGDEPKINTPIEGPRARSQRANQQLQLGGLEPAGQSRPRSRGGTTRRGVITARPDLVPARRPSELFGKSKYAVVVSWFRGEEALARKLDPHQHEGVERILDALSGGKPAPMASSLDERRVGYFGLFDGTGAGKTIQELAAAHLLVKNGKGPVLIVTERQAIIDDAFAKDAEYLGVPIWQWKQGPIEPGQDIFMATYFDVGLGKVPEGVFPTILFDEAHNLRNVDKATKSHVGLKLAAAAQRVLFATATPLDQPQQLWYLAPLLDETPEAALLRIGIRTIRNPRKPGAMKFVPEPGLTQAQLERNLERMFDDMFRRGVAIKREVPLDNLEVNLRRIHIDEEQRKEVLQTMEEAKVYYQKLGVPSFSVAGLTMMVGRQALEKFKVIEAVKHVERILKAGKKVLIYAYRVNDGMWVANNGLEALAIMLEKQYGAGSVGKLFGGGNGLKEQRYRQQTLERFQHGDLRILVAHPQQGGTGINADDIYGDAPREIVMITPPFSALEMVQIAGRVARLTTKSHAILNLLITDMRVDTWNLDIYLQKFRNLRAAVKGDVDKLKPRENEQYEPQAAYSQESPREQMRIETDPRQLEFNWRQDLALLGRLEPAPAPRGLAGLDRGAASGLPPGTTAEEAQAVKLRASIIRERMLEYGQINLVGQECKGIADAAVLAQVIRSKNFETSLWLMVKGGKVLHHYAVTKRVPDAVQTMRRGHAGMIQHLASQADWIVQVHNHPSGDWSPSAADVKSWQTMSEWLGPKFIGMVIDHRKAVVWDNGEQVEIDLPGSETDPLLQSAPSPLGLLLPQPIDPRHVAAVAAHLVHDADTMTLVFVDANARVTAVGDAPRALWDRPDWQTEVPNQIREAARAAGASYAFGVYTGNGPLESQVEHLVTAGILTDAFVRGRQGLSVWGGLLQRGVETAERGNPLWLGMDLKELDVLRLAQDQAEYAAGDKLEQSGLHWQPAAMTGAYRLRTPRLKGRVPVMLSGMQHVRPVEMPEILKLATELLSGQLPKLKKMRQALGMMHGIGSGRITLDPRIFANPEVAAKVLAHELGHLVDYLPNHDLNRGNLLGRLLTLHKFLKDTFGGVAVTNKELREELLAVTMYWKPYDRAKVPKSYDEYRRSAVELYADALSVLLNSPGLLQRLAPKWYAEFWDRLDRKPEVKDALFRLQDFLAKGRVNLLEERTREVEKMFADGEQLFKDKVKARQERGRSFQGFWMELTQDLVDRFAPAIARANEVAGRGAYPGREDPRDILDRHGLREVETYRWLRRLYETVVQPLEQAGLTLQDFGKVLLWERIMTGDRSVLANPLGHDPQAAKDGLMKWRLDHGLEQWTLIKDGIARFHEMVFNVVEKAVDVGAYNRKVFENRLKPNKDFYAAFQVLDYLEDYMPPGIKKQIGTFKRVANPFISTVLKTASLQNLIAWQEAKNTVLQLVRQHFPGEIAPARMRGPFGQQEPVPDPDRGLLMRLEDGRPVWYYVDPYIARAFETVTPGHLRRALKLLDYGFRQLFYPLYITYSAGFMLALSPMRDYQRTAQNLPTKFNRVSLWVDYLRTFMDARSRFLGQASPLMREMEANRAVGTPYDTFAQLWRDDALGQILRRYTFLPNEEARGIYDRYVFGPIHKLLGPVEAIGELLDAKLRAATGWNVRPAHALLHPLDTVEFYGMILDTLPKTSAYKILRRRGMTPKQAAEWVRNNAGLPAVHRKGLALETVRALVPFWNVFVQGWRADAKLASHPKTRGGWWLRWGLTDGLLAMLQGLAAGGILGAAIKELFDGISEYRKTNYQVLPVGFVAGGDYGKRVGFLQVPRHETSRLLSGITYKAFKSLGEGGMDQVPVELLDFGAAQFPTFNPILTMGEAGLEFAAGQNPRDPFRGENIIPRTQFDAGYLTRLEPMGRWVLNESGMANFITWDPTASTMFQTVISAVPGVNRFVKVTDQGYREQQEEQQRLEQAVEPAQAKMKLADATRSVLSEYSRLKGLKAEHRTPEQELRYMELGTWYSSIYRVQREAIQEAVDAGDDAAAAAARRDLDEMTKAFRRQSP